MRREGEMGGESKVREALGSEGAWGTEEGEALRVREIKSRTPIRIGELDQDVRASVLQSTPSVLPLGRRRARGGAHVCVEGW